MDFNKRFSQNVAAGVTVPGDRQIAVGMLSVSNDNASEAWVQLFDSPTTPTLGTGFVMQIKIPADATLIMTANRPENGLFQSLLTGFGIGIATAKDGATPVTNTCSVVVEYN